MKTGFLCICNIFTALHQNGIRGNDIDVILITHFHGDHYGGVPYFLLDAAIYKRNKPITIVSPPGGKERITALLQLLYAGTEVWTKLDIHFIEYVAEETIDFDTWRVTAFKVEHSKHLDCYGLRLEMGDKIISYSGDTQWCDSLIALSDRADIFICECCFYALIVEGHMNYKMFASKKNLLNTGRIVLTHFDAEILPRLHEIPELCASDGMVIEL